MGKTQFLGLPIGERSLWQAKGARRFPVRAISSCAAVVADAIISNIYETAQKVLAPYKDATTGPPDPAFALRMTNDIFANSNLYALQKFYEGPFQLDVYYENNKQHIDGEGTVICLCLT